MILAHLPAGYLLADGFRRRKPAAKYLFAATLLGAILPDLDLIWFYFLDARAFHHHRYWVHIPMFWCGVAVATLPLLVLFGRGTIIPAIGFFSGVFLHLVLDTLAGDILWGWPWSDRFFHLVTVQPKYPHWVLNFLLHPVALAELAIILAAACLFWHNHKVKNR